MQTSKEKTSTVSSNEDYFLLLERYAHLTPDQIREVKPSLFSELDNRTTEVLRTKLAEKAGRASEDLKTIFERPELRQGRQPGRDARQHVLDAIEQMEGIPEEQRKAAKNFINRLDLKDPLMPDTPLNANRVFRADLRRGQLHRLGQIAGVNTEKMDILFDRGLSLHLLEDERFRVLVEEKTLSKTEAKNIGLATSLIRFVDGQTDLATYLKQNRKLPRIGKVTSIMDLVELEESDWQTIINGSKIVLPEAVNREDYADFLAKKAGLLYPSARLLGKLVGKEVMGLTEQIQLINRFQEKNPQVEFLHLNWNAGDPALKTLDFSDFSKGEKNNILTGMKTCRRIYRITRDADQAAALLLAGYHSGLTIVFEGLQRFKAKTRLPKKVAELVFKNAQESSTGLLAAIGAIMDLLKGGFDLLTVGNTAEGLTPGLKNLPGFSELFGNQDFCQCEHCQSIYGPAAYFVDTMDFIHRDILASSTDQDTAADQLSLAKRRPDLWDLPLTCENTDTLIPYLQIANEIMERYLASKSGITVEEVYRNILYPADNNANWQMNIRSTRQPFCFPLERLNLFLRHFDKSRAEITKILLKPIEVQARSMLNLSPPEYKLITTPYGDVSDRNQFLTNVYGITFEPDAEAGGLKTVNVQAFLPALDLSRETFGQLIKTTFVQAGSNPRIVCSKESLNSIQNDIELVTSLTEDALDRMHRFTRLWRKLSWNIPELDLVVKHLTETGLASGLDTEAIKLLAFLRTIQERFEISVEQLCALTGNIPMQPVNEGESGLLDRLFNNREINRSDDLYPLEGRVFTFPGEPIGETEEHFRDLHRLLGGLKASETELYQLIEYLGDHLTFPDSLDTDLHLSNEKQTFSLNLKNLSLLYRHLHWARLLDLSIPELFQLMDLAGAKVIDKLTDIPPLLKLYDGWKSLDFSLDDLGYVTGRKISLTEEEPRALQIAQQVIDQISADQALLFADTIFAFIEGVTDEMSKTLIEEFKKDGIIEQMPDGEHYRLSKDIHPDQVPIPADTKFDDHEVLKKHVLTQLFKYHPAHLIPHYLSGQLALSTEQIRLLILRLGYSLSTSTFLQAIQNENAVPIAAIVVKLLPLDIVFSHKKWAPKVLAFVFKYPLVFGLKIAENKLQLPFSLTAIQRLSWFKSFLPQDAEGFTEGEYASALHPDAQNHLECAANMLQTEPNKLASFSTNAEAPKMPVERLVWLREVIRTADYLGVGGTALEQMTSENYDELQTAGDRAFAAFRAKYETEEKWEEKIGPYRDALLARQRDGLTDYLLHPGESIDYKFGNTHDLYHYFLLDPEMEPCFQTSRIVAAHSSLQLYVQRCLMNLETDEHGNSITVSPEAAAQWEWRKNYRIWEANRKVFLYPENYVEPDLRDNKTPLFEELESELLQQEINADTVLDAYAKYLRGFDEVGHLKIAGSYLQKDELNQTDLLHLFGVTPSDPPVYYYRTVENYYYGEILDTRNTAWRPWRKVDLQIPVRNVSPVVFNGRLYVFWVSYTTQPKTEFQDGNSIFAGYDHKISLEFTKLQLDSSWTPPQKVTLYGEKPFTEGDGVIQDPLVAFEGTIPKADLLQAVDDKYLNAIMEDLKAFISPIPTPTLAAYGGDKRRYILVLYDFASSLDDCPLFEFFVYTNIFAWDLPSFTQPKFDDSLHITPKDAYTLTGFQWKQVFPTIVNGSLLLHGANFSMLAKIDFYDLAIEDVASREGQVAKKPLTFTIVPNSLEGNDSSTSKSVLAEFGYPKMLVRNKEEKKLYRGKPPVGMEQPFYHYAYRTLVVRTEKDGKVTKYWSQDLKDEAFPEEDLYREELAQLRIRDKISIINNAFEDAVIDANGDLLLIQGEIFWDSTFQLKRLGTTLSETITRQLFESGVDTLLNTKNQANLGEAGNPIIILNTDELKNKLVTGQIDYAGPYGVYFREIFFHIPFLLANHLNSQGKYAEAQRWYHYIFDPTATEVLTGDDSTQDCYWRYLEFRNLTAKKLWQQLTDSEAIHAYETDPFNPHAIAQLRLSAYQKAVVMKYIDNLLDWGDHLFGQDTMESVNEATLLYIMAADILGPRPASLGRCSETLGDTESDKTYSSIQQYLAAAKGQVVTMDEFVSDQVEAAELPESSPGSTWHAQHEFAVSPSQMQKAAREAGLSMHRSRKVSQNGSSNGGKQISTASSTGKERSSPIFTPVPGILGTLTTGAGALNGLTQGIQYWSKYSKVLLKLLSHFFMLQQISTVFCIPHNKDLQQYWDRVEDRLFKIRNCMNISGEVRQLALFAPEIDPMLLVKAKAAGLSLEDILDTLSGNLPPYRFSYLIERAKAYAGELRNFGSALLSALEKKDGEEMAQLQAVHRQNILKQMEKVKTWEIEVAEETLEMLRKRETAVQYRIDYYDNLLNVDLISPEREQSKNQQIASGLQKQAGILDTVASINYFIVKAGAPTAIVFGGDQIGSASEAFSQGLKSVAGSKNINAGQAGAEASFERRRQEWKHQKQLADHELAQVQKDILAAEIRRDIAKHSLVVHQREIEQAEEVYELYRDKFTNLGLYTWLSTQLQKLYKQAFNNAFALARLAEQAFRFERNDDTIFLTGSYFEAPRAGLLAGERLSVDLQNMERRFLETNYRDLEITQSFSLLQVDPAALITLRENGECTFTIPEIFFDLAYPGHYRRRLKAVRLTIPCVTGPYVNIGAQLSLQHSEIRMAANLTDDPKEVPLSRTVSIATSTAQNDAGVFELNFRDERYMPFEGAGAVNSEWKLQLPKHFRPFDYYTINDVILHLSYTAERDGGLRQAVEGELQNTEHRLKTFLAEQPFTRVFSLRQEFPNVFQKLLHSPAGTAVPFEVTDKHFPVFLRGKEEDLTVHSAKVVVAPIATDEGTPTVSVDSKTAGDDGTFSLMNLIAAHEVKLQGEDTANVQDILLVIEYTLDSSMDG